LRPSVYELKGEKSAQDLVDFAAVILVSVFPKSDRVVGVSGGFMTVFDVDLSQ